MFTFPSLSRSVMAVLTLGALHCHLEMPAQAQEPEYATVALLFGNAGFTNPEDCLEKSVGILLDSPLGNDSDSVGIGSSSDYFGNFASQNLVATNGAYISSGGLLPIVWGFADALPPQKGFMRLGNNSGSVVELCVFVSKSGDTLNPSGSQSRFPRTRHCHRPSSLTHRCTANPVFTQTIQDRNEPAMGYLTCKSSRPFFRLISVPLIVSLVFGLCWCSTTLAGKPIKSSPAYEIVDLLGLPGDWTQSDAVALSQVDAAGQFYIAGDSLSGASGDNAFHAVIWNADFDGAFVGPFDLGFQGDTSATGVNDQGIVTIERIVGQESQAWVHVPGGPAQQLPTDGGVASYARGINNEPQVVGWVVFEEEGFRTAVGALWMLDENGTPSLPILLGSFIPFAISDTGVMAGDDESQNPSRAAVASFDEVGTLQITQLSTPPDYSGGHARAVSDNGNWVAGSTYHDGKEEAFVWSEQTGLIDLGWLGGQTSIALGVNNFGEAVGLAHTGEPRHPEAAFVWKDARLQNLNDLVEGRVHLVTAKAINDMGHIVGVLDTGKPAHESHGYLLVPSP